MVKDTGKNELPEVFGNDYGCVFVLEARKKEERFAGSLAYPATPWKPIKLYIHEDRCQRAAERLTNGWLEYRSVEYGRH